MFFVDASNKPNSFSINLIHRDSSMSPLYDSSKTLAELVRNAATRSISRSNRLDFSIDRNESSSPSSSIETIIVPDHGEYLMKFSIGTPAIERLGIFDTGSDLTWVQCSPCKSCFPQDAPLFDPTQSSTYMDVPCESQPCKLIPENQRECGNSRECYYIQQYGENSITIGKLGSDSIIFGSTGGGQSVTLTESIFGCGMYNNFTFEISSKASGIVGLGAGPLSLVSQIGDQIANKFSYCMVPFTSTSTGKLKFGNQTMVSGNGVVSTPLITKPSLPSYYFLNLEGISIGQKTIQTSQTDGNMVIDSVPILTHLEQRFYNDFISSVKEAINVESVEDAPSPFDFCLRDGTNMSVPDFVFHFTGADVVLNKKNMFIPLDNNLVCMTVLPTTGISIFGNWAQVDFQVEYDLGGKKVSFAPTDCSSN
ncbi:aspartic proteinase CDR1-like [Abrus precatorius]|uniref:Aspartic proteinase CDR1-like n=1 Tax=Abrus precatorius TaxID=3816 RepID=A0A8B8KIE9_ABRPR|nr:aspartic proteinase CDR1-like [Abrus precatorius]